MRLQCNAIGSCSMYGDEDLFESTFYDALSIDGEIMSDHKNRLE